MSRRILMLVGITLGALLQLFLPPWPIFGGIKPPILMAFALYYALNDSRSGMWIAVFWAALLHDGLDLGGFGPALIAFPVIGLLVHRVRLEIFVDGAVTQMICGALGAIFLLLVTTLIYTINGQRPFHFGYTLLRLIGSGILGMVTLPVISLAMNKAVLMIPKRRGYGWQ
jgi:rod shape-determining protein MreD